MKFQFKEWFTRKKPENNPPEKKPREKTEDEKVFEGMVELLKSRQELDDFQTKYLKSRLVSQIVYMDGKSNKCKEQYLNPHSAGWSAK